MGKKTSKADRRAALAADWQGAEAPIREALDLLSRHSRFAPGDGVVAVAPLPSLLARCEAVLEQPRREEPVRLICGFVCSGEAEWAAALRSLPNVDVLDEVASSLQAGQAVLARSVTQAAAARGKRVVFHRGFAGEAPDGLAEARAALLIRHPLLTYVDAVHQGRLCFAPASLGDYARRYLTYLEAHQALPMLRLEDLQADPEAALAQAAAALRLGAADPVAVDAAGLGQRDAEILLPGRETSGSEDYRRLCQALGYDPDRVPVEPAFADEAQFAPVQAGVQSGDTGARIAGFMPKLEQLVAEEQGPGRLTLSGLVAAIDACVARQGGGFYEAFDVAQTRLVPRDAALLGMGCAAHFAASHQMPLAISLLSEAGDFLDPLDRTARLAMAELFLNWRKPAMALDLILGDALSGPAAFAPNGKVALSEMVQKIAPVVGKEHGHALLIPCLRENDGSRKKVLIEIGTTRERVPEQGSTEKLAEVCAEHGIDFVTVDMDPRNSEMARRMFRRRNFPFRAVTAKGEDFLADWQGPIDYCFLDAYDFDHGMHSELRQSRYEAFLGARIDDAGCHKMHLDCAVSLVAKLSPDGVICFDDVWLDDAGEWTAKGKTAMPYLLENGFKVTEARDRAALLVRAKP